MIVAHFDVETLSGVRLSASPTAEALSLLELAASGRIHPLLGDPGASTRFALRDPDVAMIASLVAKGWRYLPDLLLPQPSKVSSDRLWAAQMERIGATPPEVAAAQMSLVERPLSATVREAVESGVFAKRVARGFERFWSYAAREMWPRLRDRVEADVTARATLAATAGVGAMLDSLHPKVRWTGSALEVHKNWIEQSHRYQGRDVVLVPSVLSWPKLSVQFGTPDTEVVMYPVRNFGDVGARDGVSRLVGSTRARLLHDLDIPRSTSELSERHRLAQATVSYHLSVLHGSGLVAKSRDSRSVLYRRTEVGDRMR